MPAQKYLRKKAEKLCVKGEIATFWNIDRTFKSTCCAIQNSFWNIDRIFKSTCSAIQNSFLKLLVFYMK